ncbi:MAG: hypothetical protein WC511_06080 [Candidatus Pacearchaeota archaeon]
MNSMRDIKKYDKLLKVKKNLDGSIQIIRQSPFNSQKEFEIIEIKNKYSGSFRWIIDRLIKMDTRKFDIVGKCMRNNSDIRNQKEDDRMTKDIADFWEVGGESILLN